MRYDRGERPPVNPSSYVVTAGIISQHQHNHHHHQHHQHHQPLTPAATSALNPNLQCVLFRISPTPPLSVSYISYQHAMHNYTLILWTALSLALGLEIRGDIIRGTPCIKRYHQLFCPTAGTQYPIDRIELFIDENKALMKRMYGEFQTNTEYGPPGEEVFESERKKRGSGGRRAPDPGGGPDHQEATTTGPDGGPSYFGKLRSTRQTQRNNQSSDTGRVDACQSKVEIVTPYWAANSAGKVRAIVNTQHFEQAIHQEVCVKVQTGRCSGDCGCEQKYKWHRLLAYDPDNDCKGIFMDWFLFPSCCVCRCAPTFNNNNNNN